MKKMKKIYLILFPVLLILSGILFYISNTFKIERTLSYKEQGNIDYKVWLKENSYYDTPYLEKDRKYVASLIDHLQVDYKYNFTGNRQMDYKLKYYVLISALVKDKTNEEKLIFEKKQYLTEEQTKTFEGQSSLDLEDTFNIDYNYFNGIINKFVTDYSISQSENTLKTEIGINIEGQNAGFDNLILDESLMTLEIPLTDNTVDITPSYKEIDNSGQKTEVSTDRTVNLICAIAAYIFAAGCLFCLAMCVWQYFKIKLSKSEYQRRLDFLTYKYNKIIFKIKDTQNLKYKSIVDLPNFDDLLNFRDCINEPISLVTLEGKEEACFAVLKDEVLYRYILKGKHKNKHQKEE